MEVVLVSKNEKIVSLVSSASRSCRSILPTHDLIKMDWEDQNGRDREAYIQHILDNGHEGIAEFAWYVFSVSGLSRVATHQLVRHRIASYLQMSSRDTDICGMGIRMPMKIEQNEQARELFSKASEHSAEVYKKLRELSIEEEDARFIFPDGVMTHITVGMNGRGLFHFLRQRLCHRAQWEIRELAERMHEILLREDPCLFLRIEASCISGRCQEDKSDCNFMETKEFSERKSRYESRIRQFEREHGP